MWISFSKRRCAWTLAALFAVSVIMLSCSQVSDLTNLDKPKMEPGARVVAAQYTVGGYMFRYAPAPGMKEQHSVEEIATANRACVTCHINYEENGDTMHNGALSNG